MPSVRDRLNRAIERMDVSGWPSTEVVDAAERWVTKTKAIIEEAQLPWTEPHIGVSPNEIVFEWWGVGSRDLTVWVGASELIVIGSWSSNIAEMEDRLFSTEDQVRSAWRWLWGR